MEHKKQPSAADKKKEAAAKALHTRRMNQRQRKIDEILAVLPEDKRFLAKDLGKNFVWLSVRVEELREQLDRESFVIVYNNGGGQRGVRENPLLGVYHKLSARYTDAYLKLMKSLPDDAKEEKDELEQFLGL